MSHFGFVVPVDGGCVDGDTEDLERVVEHRGGLFSGQLPVRTEEILGGVCAGSYAQGSSNADVRDSGVGKDFRFDVGHVVSDHTEQIDSCSTKLRSGGGSLVILAQFWDSQFEQDCCVDRFLSPRRGRGGCDCCAGSGLGGDGGADGCAIGNSYIIGILTLTKDVSIDFIGAGLVFRAVVGDVGRGRC